MHSHRLFALVLFLLIAVSCTSSSTTRKTNKQYPLPVGTLSATEVQNLFSHHTVDSITVSKKRKSISYYDPNGQIRQLRQGSHRSGFWRITKQGRICLQMEDRPESCRAVALQNGQYLKFVIKKNGQHKPVVRYLDFRNGNPLGL